MSALAEALGHQAVLALSRVAGGRRLRIPSMCQHPVSVRARARLIALVGHRLAEDLVTNFALNRVYIPRGPSPHNARTKAIDARKIGRLTKRGLSASQIAVRLGCSERTVYAKRAHLAQRRKERP